MESGQFQKTQNQKTILAELTKLNLILNARRSIDELELLAGVWIADCGHMQEGRFIQAVAECRRRTKWFPTPVEINEQYNAIVRVAQMKDMPQIEQFPSLSPREEAERLRYLKSMITPKSSVMYVSERYKPAHPMDPNIIYVPEQGKQRAHQARKDQRR